MRLRRRLVSLDISGLIALLGLALLGASGCGGDAETAENGAGGGGTTSATTGAGGASSASSSDASSSVGATTSASTSTSTSTSSGTGGGPTASCTDAPAGASLPAPLPTYGGSCPALVPGENTLTSSGADRKFLLVTPSNIAPGEQLPVLFLWHWLGGTAEDFLSKGEVAAAVEAQRFIAVLPRAKGDLTFQWPFDISVSDARLDEELQFFDDMLACLGETLPVDACRVGSAGVSAGALFTDQLAGRRAEHLASFLSLSGGTGGFAVRPFANPEHKLPALVLWGGPTDNCQGVFSFEALSQDLEDSLSSGGHFFLECIHNCGHSAPPLDPPAAGGTIYGALWQFVLDHPYWQAAGTSPYQASGLPAGMPSWCGIGAGSATPRVGPCEGGGC